jgi:hypothetical protein
MDGDPTTNRPRVGERGSLPIVRAFPWGTV